MELSGIELVVITAIYGRAEISAIEILYRA
jgi:hypothetical protein